MKIGAALASAIFISMANFASVQAQEEEAVLDVVQRLFDAIAQRDSAALGDVSLPSMRTVRVRDTGPTTATVGTLQEFKDGLAAPGPALHEEMVNPEVKIEGAIATVWGPYLFLVDGEFSHCGVDSFQLVKEQGEWKVAHLMWTVMPDRDRCADFLGGTGD